MQVIPPPFILLRRIEWLMMVDEEQPHHGPPAARDMSGPHRARTAGSSPDAMPESQWDPFIHREYTNFTCSSIAKQDGEPCTRTRSGSAKKPKMKERGS
jgi:hypothetical protein